MAHNGHAEAGTEDWGDRQRQHSFLHMQVPDR